MTKEPNRQERKKAQTRVLIFETAMELFLKQGYDDTTIEQIVAKADLAKGTFLIISLPKMQYCLNLDDGEWKWLKYCYKKSLVS
ncbi:MAG: TetR/AcrR family transcriptional regulator [Desulfosporosinus sp.]|nr:TetR/AcrR family transcriptional regulator [Desulfosporosinus sp.]